MDFVNRATTALFDLLMPIFGLAGPTVALILISGLVGVLGLICFKYISWQGGIKSTKAKIWGGIIEIRLYQDDLVIVARAVGKVLGRNVQYLFLNFGPIVPLLIPFGLVFAQLVVRQGFDPIPLADRPVTELLAGEGTLVEVTLGPEARGKLDEAQIELPPTLEAISPVVRIPSEGRLLVEVAAVASGVQEMVVRVGGERVTKVVATGDVEPPAKLQPERARGMAALLWPGERSTDGTGVERILVPHPDRPVPGFGWSPLPLEGVGGLMILFFVFSIVIGGLVLKPLGVQI
jgi:hypothetical protein